MYVQYYDSAKADWVPNPNGIAMMECPRPESQPVTTTMDFTSTMTVTESKTIVQEKPVTAEVQTLSFVQQYCAYLIAIVTLVGLTLGYTLSIFGRFWKLREEQTKKEEEELSPPPPSQLPMRKEKTPDADYDEPFSKEKQRSLYGDQEEVAKKN